MYQDKNWRALILVIFARAIESDCNPISKCQLPDGFTVSGSMVTVATFEAES